MEDDFFSNASAHAEGAAPNVFDDVLVAAPQERQQLPAAAADPFAEVPIAATVTTPAAAAVATPAAATTPAATPTQSPQRASHQNLVNEQAAAIQNRTFALDKATTEKEDRQKKAALAYLADIAKQREAKLKVIRDEHRKEQLENEKKASELKQSGAVWASVGLIVDLKKPNAHSKKTEKMKQVLLNLEKRHE